MHNALGLTRHVEPEVTPFHARPFLVPHSDRYVEALHDAIRDDDIRSLSRHVGAVWQFADSTDILSSADRCARVADALTPSKR